MAAVLATPVGIALLVISRSNFHGWDAPNADAVRFLQLAGVAGLAVGIGGLLAFAVGRFGQSELS